MTHRSSTPLLGLTLAVLAAPACAQTVRQEAPPTTAQAGSELRDPRETHLRNVRQLTFDGSNKRRVTDFPGANFAPYWHPSGEKIIFSSNMDDPRAREFELYLINVDGSGLERITWSEEFDGFPVFSPDGSHLVFASNRNGSEPGETTVFMGEWVE